MRYPTVEVFQKNITTHGIDIERDDGIFRHIRFSKPDSIDQSFQLTTWPGHVCISGDMGTFVFSRIPDMFNFFRGEPGRLGINPGYWLEKLQSGAFNNSGIAKQWSAAKFEEAVWNDFNDWAEDEEDQGMIEEVRQQIQDDVIECADHEFEAMEAIDSFDCDAFDFADFWEHDCTDWTYHYIWCLYAIVWGVGEYDKAKEAA